MPTAAKKRTIVRSMLALMAFAVIVSAFLLVPMQRAHASDDYPWSSAVAVPSTGDWGYATTCPPNDGNCMAIKEHGTDGKTYGVIDPYGYYLRYCTSFVAWKLATVNGWTSGVGSIGDASAWKKWAQDNGYTVDQNPGLGSVAWFSFDHVAWVSNLNTDGTVQIEEYNNPAGSGTYNTRSISKTSAWYIHFKDLSSSSTPTPTPAPSIIALKSSLAPDGAIETFAATNGRVTQHWYYDGGNSGTTDLIDIAQHNIIGIDKLNIGSTEALYTAVSDGVWETTWVPGVSGPQSAKIVYPGLSGITLSGVLSVVAENTFENNYRVHHLYILAQDGPYEAYWKDSDPLHTVHLSRLIQINGPIAFTHSIGPDGSEQLYVAVPTWVYEVTWIPGSGVVNMYNVINIPQGDIRSVVKGDNLSGGGQLLYTTTSTTVWQTYWTTTGGPYSQGTIATGQTNAKQALKVVTPDGIHHVYLATPDHVQEYWWPPAFGGGEIIRISQGNITAISQILDGSMQLLLTAAGSNVWETWWNSSQAPTTPSTPLFSVTA